MRYLCFILLIALAGCSTQSTPIPQPAMLTHSSQDAPVPPVQLRTPDLQYWAGVETNYSYLQTSSNLVDWVTLPGLYYGAPGTNTLQVTNIWPNQFYRMVKL